MWYPTISFCLFVVVAAAAAVVVVVVVVVVVLACSKSLTYFTESFLFFFFSKIEIHLTTSIPASKPVSLLYVAAMIPGHLSPYDGTEPSLFTPVIAMV